MMIEVFNDERSLAEAAAGAVVSALETGIRQNGTASRLVLAFSEAANLTASSRSPFTWSSEVRVTMPWGPIRVGMSEILLASPSRA